MTEATYGVSSMQVELGRALINQLDKAMVDELQKSIYDNCRTNMQECQTAKSQFG